MLNSKVASGIVAAFIVVALAVPASSGGGSCTRVGTNHRDRLYGSEGGDVMCLKAGRDYANARGASDIIKGGPDADTLVGGGGNDAIHGFGGNDDLFATDGSGGDLLDGGLGYDRCYGDFGDTFAASCNHSVKV